jgi:leader peptidase (prepilin peptidase)/N-methyltransferase
MDPALAYYSAFFGVVAFVLGAVVGSFLNVCIYRMPLDLSVNEPKRSFCPSCKKQIPWHQNLPLLSWLFLRGKCANCGSRIAFRYFSVELLTALLFLAVWRSFSWDIALVYFVFVSLLIAATFIDFEHYIIPDEITLGGTAAGVVACLIVPGLMLTDSRLIALGTSIGSAALGYSVLWLVLEGGKLAFGKKKIRLDRPTPFTWTRNGDDADFVVGEDRGLWSDNFAREKRRPPAALRRCGDRRPRAWKTTLRFHYNSVDGRRSGYAARQRRSHQRHRARARDSARSDGARRLEIPGVYRRVSWLARGVVQRLCRLAAGVARRDRHNADREAGLVGEVAIRALSRRRRAHLDVLR